MLYQNISEEIAILPPYKEKFSPENFGSVSLYIKDTNENSKFKNKIKIYINITSKTFKGFKSVNVPKTFHHILFGKNMGHTKSFLKIIKKKAPKIIEIHNRPKSALEISKFSPGSKLFLYYHNDPLSFKDTSSLKKRLQILENCHSIFFVSNFLKKRFLEGIPNNKLLRSKLNIIYNGVNPIKQISFEKKKLNIVYVGELEKKKGFDIFFHSANKIIDQFPNWKVHIFGKLNTNYKYLSNKHNRIIFHNFKKNNYVKEFLKKSSISVIPSVWNEPFGRTLIESINSGTATISSNKGGLKEINKFFKTLILNKIDKKTIYIALKKLIMSNDERSYYSNNNVSNTPFTLNKITSTLDNHRSKILS